MPGADLGDAVLAQGQHPLLAGDGGDFGLGGAGDRHLLEPLAEAHHRVDPDPAAGSRSGCSAAQPTGS